LWQTPNNVCDDLHWACGEWNDKTGDLPGNNFLEFSNSQITEEALELFPKNTGLCNSADE
jgi:hypothetical protein